MFRPGYMRPIPGMKHTQKYYKYLDWMYPVLRRIFPAFMGTLEQLAKSMINAARKGCPKGVLELRDVRQLNTG